MPFENRFPLMTRLGFRESALPDLKRYIDLLWTANEELNLLSRKMSFAELIDNHVLDCLLPLAKFPADVRSVADFGSGGGLPGVMYAIQFPETAFFLFEKSPKKRDFLRRCKALAPNLEIRGEIPPKLGDIELVTARAFKPLDVILELSRSHYENGGRYFLLKARRDKIEEEWALAKKKFKNLRLTIEPLQSPVLDVERHLVLI